MANPNGGSPSFAFNEGGSHAFSASQFGWTDGDSGGIFGDSFSGVIFTTIPSGGTFTLGGSPFSVTAGQSLSVAQLNQLVWTPAENDNGSFNFTFQVQSRTFFNPTNGSGGTDQSPNTFSLTVNPVADNANITGDITGTVQEDVTLGAAGTLAANDPDAGENSFQAVLPANLVKTYGSFTFNNTSGAWTYALNNTSAAVQNLRNGDVVTDTLTVKSLDGTDTETITVTIKGTNEAGGPVVDGNKAPVISAANADATVQAGNALAITVGDGHFTDPDAGTNLSYVLTVDGSATLPAWATFNADTGALSISDAAPEGNHVFAVVASDGKLSSAADEFNVTVTAQAAGVTVNGTKGNDKNLMGGDGDDTLNGKRGNDKMTGGDGGDTFVFSTGHDKVLDFDGAEGDMINLGKAKGIADFEDLMANHVKDTDSGLKITAEDGSSMFLKGVDADDLTADMFLF